MGRLAQVTPATRPKQPKVPNLAHPKGGVRWHTLGTEISDGDIG